MVTIFIKINKFIFSEKFYLLMTFFISVFASIYFFSSGENLAFNDAKSHLDISRRIIDNTNPGFVQLGSSWLPLLHILFLPFIWNNFLWHSGLAGAFVSMPAFILASFFLYRSIFLITRSNYAAFIGGILYIFNPNSLYAQTTGLTEILYTCVLSGSIYFLLKWNFSRKISYLILSAFMVFLTSLTRYEGWALVVASFILIFIVTYLKEKKYKKIESYSLLFGVIAFAGVIFWLMWQFVIFGSPIYFLHNEFSSVGQTKVAVDLGLVPSYHKIDIAFLSFWYAAANTGGFIIMFIGSFAFIFLAFFSWSKKLLIEYFIIALSLTPFLFELYTLYSGSAPINVPQIYPYTSFNIRFGLYLFPAISLFIGYLFFSSKRVIKIFLIVVICLQFYILYSGHQIAILMEEGAVVTSDQEQAYMYLRQNYKKGYILGSAAALDPVMFDSHIDLKYFISEGSGLIWSESLVNPKEQNIVYIVSSKNILNEVRDGVYLKLLKNNRLKYDYHVVLENNGFIIYKIND